MKLVCSWFDRKSTDDWNVNEKEEGGGAWPFLVGGVICLVNSVNERDLNLLTSLHSYRV